MGGRTGNISDLGTFMTLDYQIHIGVVVCVLDGSCVFVFDMIE